MTITVQVTASVNGKKFSVSETCTVENLYDVGQVGSELKLGAYIEYTNDGTIAFNQASPSVAYATNPSVGLAATHRMRMDDGVNNDYVTFKLLPGMAMVLHEHTHGAGMVKLDGTTQTTYNDVIVLEVSNDPFGQGQVEGRMIVASLAAS